MVFSSTIVRAVAGLVLAAAVLVAAWFYTGPRFQADVSLIGERSAAQCQRYLMTTLGFGSESSAQVCLQAQANGMAWFRATARNVGMRGAYLKTCFVDGRDNANRIVYTAELTVGWLDFPAGPHLDGGERISWEWFTYRPGADVRHYEVQCKPEEYPGGVPILLRLAPVGS